MVARFGAPLRVTVLMWSAACSRGARFPCALASTFHHEVAMPRDKIILACSECKNRNYFTTKNKRLHPERVEWKKYCPRCNKHLVHKETK
jgi:large subunit ribosomal protein L33